MKQNEDFYCCLIQRRVKRDLMIEVDIKTYHGHIFTCNKCSKFHFEFNQLGIDFSKLDTLKDFGKYLNELNEDDALSYNESNNFIRKIHNLISWHFT